MRAKEYLSRLRNYDILINVQQESIDQLNRLRDLSTSIKAMAYDGVRVQTSPTNSAEDLMVKIIDLERDIVEKIDAYVDARAEIMSQIDQMDSPMHRAILFKHYVLGKSLRVIAEEEYLSYDRMKHLHGYALQEFEQKFLREK